MRCIWTLAIVAFLGATSAPASATFHCTITGEDLKECCCKPDGADAFVKGGCCCEIRRPQPTHDAASTARVAPPAAALAVDLDAPSGPAERPETTRITVDAGGPASRAAPPLYLLLGIFRT